LKRIIKHQSPTAFEEWKKFKNPTNWNDLDGYPVAEGDRDPESKYYSKQELRAALLSETQNLCCYCESKLENNPLRIKVEHVQPKIGTTKQHLLFEYSNLLISCNGGERDPKPKLLHCDTSKKDRIIPITPFDPIVESEIDYEFNGVITGKTEDARATIGILNLDIIKLRNRRLNKISGYIFKDEEETELISVEDASKLYSKVILDKGTEHFSAIIRSLRKIMGTGTNNG